MIIGIPECTFYYRYEGFIRRLFQGTNLQLLKEDSISPGECEGLRNSKADDRCIPVKLADLQIKNMRRCCDAVIIPRLMRDVLGRWYCPKALSLPELCKVSNIASAGDIFVTEALCFDDEKSLKKALLRLCMNMGMSRCMFDENFKRAYEYQKNVELGIAQRDIVDVWELAHSEPEEGEIILPNVYRVHLASHCHNVRDRFLRLDIVKRLDYLGIEALGEDQMEKIDSEVELEMPISGMPFWESAAWMVKTASAFAQNIDGMIYLSSTYCNTDYFIIELLKRHVREIPFSVIEIDNYMDGELLDLKLEMFLDLLERKRYM